VVPGAIGGAVGYVRVTPGDHVEIVDYFEMVNKVSSRSSGV